MVLEQILRIIIKAEDMASDEADKINDKFKDIGDTAQKANDAATNSSKKYNQTLQETTQKLNKTVSNVNKVGTEGSKSFRNLSKAEKDAVVRFNLLSDKSKGLLTTYSNLSQKGQQFFAQSSQVQGLLSEFSSLNQITSSWSGSLDYAKTKMQLLGNDTTTLRGKIQTTGMAIQAYLGTKWDNIKQKATAVSVTIKGKIGGAIDSVKGKLGGLSSKFTKLGADAKKSGNGVGFLKGVLSQTVGLIGYDLVNGMIEAGRSAINANNQLQYFGKRLKMSSSETQKFNKYIGNMQKEFRKVNMKAVGASAEEMAVKLKLPKSSLEELTKTTAVMSSAFVKEGRTQEDAILAVSDAMDGQFRRLLELGITQDMLKNNGWNGDLKDKTSLLKAMNKTLDEMGFTQTAKEITNLDEAYQALTVAGGNLIEKILVPITPLLMGVVEAAIGAVDAIMGIIDGLMSAWNSLPDWAKYAIGIAAVAIAVGLVVSYIGMLISSAGGLITILLPLITLIGGINLPLIAIVAAIGLVVAAIYEVGKAFGWWTDVNSMLAAIQKNIGRLWDAFIHHPDVQATIRAIGDTWKWLQDVTKPIVDWLHDIWNQMFPESAKGKVDGTRAIIDAIGVAFQVLTTHIRIVISILQFLWSVFQAVGSSIQAAQNKFGIFGGFLATLATPILFVWELLKKIVCILRGCSPGIIPALQETQEVFSTVWNAIAGFISGVIATVVSAIQPIIDILSLIANFYLSTFIYAWQTLIMVFSTVISAVNQIISIFSMFLSGQINLSTMLSMVWNTINTMFGTVLAIIIARVRSFASAIIARAIAAGRGFVNGIINYIKNLPGRVGVILLNVASRIASAGISWINNARSKAVSMVSGVISNVSQLPGKVYNEFMNIGSRIMSAGGQLVQKAKEIGKNIVNGLLNAMGIHSPGIIQTKVVQEFEDMTSRVEDQIEPAGDVAKTFGEIMVNQFGEVDLVPNLGYTDLDNMPEMNMNIGMDASNVDSTNSMVTSSYDNLANLTGSALQSMVDSDKLAFETIKNNDATTLTNMSNNLQQKMGLMTNNVRTNMNNIVAKNKSSWNSAKNTTNSQLNSIVNKTKSANSQMIKSWGVMKDGIVSAANKIKTDSTNHFNKLSSTIGTFYGKLKNPGRWGAGPGTGKISSISRRGSSNAGVKRITKAVNALRTPQYLTLGQVKQNPLIDSSNFGDYVIRGKNNRFSLSDIVKYDALTIPIGIGAGWVDTALAHVKKIKNTSREWDMKGPNIGRYSTNSHFKVKEFETGAPKIDFDTFRKMAEDVYSQTHYEFYYDNDHHGNWLNAFNAGSMNCLHGAESLIAMARAMGFSGSLVHGHWNQFGHYWANIAGRKMDVTGWQQRRTWTPSASHAGSAPGKQWSLEDLFNELKSTLDTNSESTIVNESVNDELNLNGEFKITHEFLNLPENISAEEVARIVNDSTNDENWIKQLVKNVRFQKLDLEMKDKLAKKNNRAGVV